MIEVRVRVNGKCKRYGLKRVAVCAGRWEGSGVGQGVDTDKVIGETAEGI